MSQSIQQVINSQNPEALETYLKLYITNDEKNLQRIYHELKNYKPNHEQKHWKKQIKQINSLGKKLTYKQKKHPDYLIKSSQLLMKNLRDRGIKSNSNPQTQQNGIKIYQQIKSKIDKPLKPNSKVQIIKQSPIIRQLSRYYINKKFYQNQIEDANLNTQQQYDRQMKEFLDRRKSLLADIKAKKNTQSGLTAGKFSQIKSKFQKTQSLAQIKAQSQNVQKAKNIIIQCDNYHQDCFIPKSCSVNQYSSLSHKLSKQQGNLDEIQADIIRKIKNERSKLIDKYDHSYLKMMSLKNQPKCKLNKYQKDLLQDQIKMRGIVNFSDKCFSK